MKRFTESRKWDNPWYRQLAPRLKLLWLWLCDSCDPAGILKPDWGLASFQIGEGVAEVDLEHFQERARLLPGGKVLLVPFIAFQYGRLSPDCKPHRPIFASLQKHNISLQDLEGYEESPIGYPKGINTLQEKEKEKEKEKGSVGLGVQGERAESDFSENGNIRLMEEIIAAYPRNGNAMEARRALAALPAMGFSLPDILAKVRIHAARFAELPEHRRQFCPGKQKYFEERRFEDSPDSDPWVFFDPAAAPKARPAGDPCAVKVKMLTLDEIT